MKHMIDPEGRRLPIKLDTTSNGEFAPVPLSAANLAGNRLAHEAASHNAKRLGVGRREFLAAAGGAGARFVPQQPAQRRGGQARVLLGEESGAPPGAAARAGGAGR